MEDSNAADDIEYFYPYAFLTDQRLMLEDEPRMVAYHRAITSNASSFKGKVVLDVGAGTGVLSVWAAQAGARAVFAVEATAMAQHAKALVKHNRVDDVVTVFEAKVEDVELPQKVNADACLVLQVPNV